MEEKVAVGFEKYLLSQVKRSSQNYQLWLLCKRVIRAKQKADVPTPGSAELGRKLGASSSQVRNRLSDLMAFYQEYLAVLHLRSNPRLNALLALEEAIEKDNEPYVAWLEKKVERLVEKSTEYNTYAYYDALRFNRLIYDWHSDKFNRLYVEKSMMIYQGLEEFVLVEKCKLYLNLISVSYDGGALVGKLELEIDEIRKEREKGAGEAGLTFSENVFYNLHLIAKESREESYQFVFNLIDMLFKKFSLGDVKFVLVVISNRISRQIVMGNIEAEQDFFKLIIILLDNPRVKITEWMLKNCVTVLCRMKKEGLATLFLNTYLPKVPGNRQEEIGNYNMAVIKMSVGEFEEASRLINQITLSESSYYLGGRFVLFRSMYKDEDYEGLLSLMKSFRGYVTRLSEINERFKTAIFYYLTCLGELVRLSLDQPFIDPQVFEKRAKQLLEKVLATTVIASRDWLIEEVRAYL
jgi:hypothetical protein